MIKKPPLTRKKKSSLPLLDRLKLAVWMVGNIDTKDDMDSWWLAYNDLWEEISEDACKLAEKLKAEQMERINARRTNVKGP